MNILLMYEYKPCAICYLFLKTKISEKGKSSPVQFEMYFIPKLGPSSYKKITTILQLNILLSKQTISFEKLICARREDSNRHYRVNI